MKTEDVQEYLDMAKKYRIIPNFWLSQEYLEFQEDAHLEKNEHVVWIQEDNKALFPPLPLHSMYEGWREYCPKIKVWSDFINLYIGEHPEFLDWEYTYFSDDFHNLEGKRWAVFRKNIKKWPNKHLDCQYTSDVPSNHSIEKLLMEWLESRIDTVIEDDQSLLKFILEGKHRAFLMNKGELFGINAWDVYSEHYVIYRYCIAKPYEPFLDEFLRSLFYNSLNKKLVVDGGVLGNQGLERFKDKLNPMLKRPVYSRQIL